MFERQFGWGGNLPKCNEGVYRFKLCEKQRTQNKILKSD